MKILIELFGETASTWIMAILALGVVLVLIILIVWLFKLFSGFTQNIGRMNNKRLNIIDRTHIDPKRQLILIRRDNIEHLIMIGGERDLVIEVGIEPESSKFPNKLPNKLASKTMPKDKPISKKSSSISQGLAAPIVSAGTKSLRHTGLLRQSKDPVFDNNPQTSDEIINKAEPDFTHSGKTIHTGTDSFSEEADVIFSDIEEKSANNKDKRRRRTDK